MLNNEPTNQTKKRKKLTLAPKNPSNFMYNTADEILDKHDVMSRLKICDRTLKTYVNEGYLRPSVIRGKRFFRLSQLLEMLDRFQR